LASNPIAPGDLNPLFHGDKALVNLTMSLHSEYWAAIWYDAVIALHWNNSGYCLGPNKIRHTLDLTLEGTMAAIQQISI
jgi:hypothetical protein